MLLVIQFLAGKQLWKPYVLLLLVCLIGAFTTNAQCYSIVRSGNVVEVEKNGRITIDQPDNIKLADGQVATADPALLLGLFGPLNSHELRVKDFNFSIPEPAVICGVEVRVKRKASALVAVSLGTPTGPRDNRVQLIKDGTPRGTNTAIGAIWNTTDTYTQYGGKEVKWETALTTQDVNSKEFGVALSVNFTGLINLLPNAQIDHVEMEVFYQPTTVLPITLSGFQAKAQYEEVQCQWSFATIEDGATVTLQRTSNDGAWQNIYSQSLARNTPSTPYSYTDKSLQPALYRYRLKMTTPNGNTTYSKEVKVDRSHLTSRSVTLAQRGAQLTVLHPADITMIQVFSGNGQPVSTSIHKTAGGSLIETAHLPSGLYLIRCGQTWHKFVKR